MKTNLGKQADEVDSVFAEVVLILIYYAINRTSAPFLAGRENKL